MGVGFVELIILFMLLLILGGLITGIVMWTTSGSGKSSEMSCGACGYAVRGLEALNCPECGTDLRMAGIRRGGSPGKRTLGIVLTFLSLGLILLGCGASSFLFMKVQSPTASPSQTIPAQPAPSQSTSSPSSLQDQVDAAVEDLEADQDATDEPAEGDTDATE